MNDLINYLLPNCIITPIACDMPYFIRTSQDYKGAWRNFIDKNTYGYKFLINPNPHMISDLILHKDKLEMLINNFKNSGDFDVGS